MKKLVFPLMFALMIWALIDQTTAKPSLILQVVGVVVFFYGMMRLMSKTPDNKRNDE